MTVLIVSSTEDPASTNIKKGLLEQSSWEEIDTFYENTAYRHSNMKDVVIVTINDRTIRHEMLDKEVEEKLGIKPKQAIYISRHKSKTGEPTLTTHPIGNYGEAQFGGETRTLSKSSPRLMTQLLRIIKKMLNKQSFTIRFVLKSHTMDPIWIYPLFLQKWEVLKKNGKNKILQM